MTYNFDPDRWYDTRREGLDARRDRGEMDESAWEAALRRLDEEFEVMLDRLDGTFQLNA